MAKITPSNPGGGSGSVGGPAPKPPAKVNPKNPAGGSGTVGSPAPKPVKRDPKNPAGGSGTVGGRPIGGSGTGNKKPVVKHPGNGTHGGDANKTPVTPTNPGGGYGWIG
jgi:hypothetical protein